MLQRLHLNLLRAMVFLFLCFICFCLMEFIVMKLIENSKTLVCRVCLGSTYFAEIENVLLKVL